MIGRGSLGGAACVARPADGLGLPGRLNRPGRLDRLVRFDDPAAGKVDDPVSDRLRTLILVGGEQDGAARGL